MKSTIDEPINLDEPHFDEEATILAARPVVPLDEVKEATRSKGGVALVLAIGGGLLIGLLVAGLIFRYLSVGAPATVETTVSEQPAQAVEQSSVESAVPADGALAVVDEEAEENTVAEKAVVAEVPESKPEDNRKARTPKASEVEPRRPVVIKDRPRRVNDEPDDEADLEMRRAQRQEQRRERRRAARQAERQERQQPTTNDDLTRIREIFEGTPRP